MIIFEYIKMYFVFIAIFIHLYTCICDWIRQKHSFHPHKKTHFSQSHYSYIAVTTDIVTESYPGYFCCTASF